MLIATDAHICLFVSRGAGSGSGGPYPGGAASSGTMPAPLCSREQVARSTGKAAGVARESSTVSRIHPKLALPFIAVETGVYRDRIQAMLLRLMWAYMAGHVPSPILK